MTSVKLGRPSGRPLRTAAISGLAFTVLYLLHRILQGTGRDGSTALAIAVAISGGVFVAMGFVSNAAETALLGVANSNEPAAVLALDQLQGRTPIVWTITALVAVISLAIHRTSSVWRWLGLVGLVAAGIFVLGSVFSVLGRTPEGRSSLIGVGLFVVWMLLLSAGLWRSASGGVQVTVEK
jgi:hypothetical protein